MSSRELLLTSLVLLTAMSCSAEITVVKRYINYFDPTGKTPVVMPKDLPVPAPLNLPPPPKTVDADYPNGKQIVHLCHTYLEPGTGRFLRLAYVGVHPGDTLPGFMDWKIWYQVCTDGGKDAGAWKPVIQQGAEFNPLHPIRPVYIGKNSFCPSTAPPVKASNGELMVPFYFPPLDAAGNYYNPAGAFTFSDGGVLIGKWTADGKDLTWDLGQTVRLEADQSTRGVDEPTVIELKHPGEFLMVIRASNDKRYDTVPSYKYCCVSRDYCRTWSKPEPFAYSDGTRFYSPAACSELIRSVKTGKLYWIGNISTTPPHGNSPRYPLVIGEVDEQTCGLIKDSVVVIDDRNPQIDSDAMQLSNFTTIQNPKTGQLVVRLTRIDTKRGEYGKVRYPPCAYVIEVG